MPSPFLVSCFFTTVVQLFDALLSSHFSFPLPISFLALQAKCPALRPSSDRFSLFAGETFGSKFGGEEAPRWPVESWRDLGETADGALSPERWVGRLDAKLGVGRVRVAAEAWSAGSWVPVPPIELRIAGARGFRGGLSEQFGMPYLFGAGLLRDRHPEAFEAGNDCANFLVAAWHRVGRALPWGSPRQLRRHLQVVEREVGTGDGVPISDDWIEDGLVVDFGEHLGAVWEDRAPVGRLTGADLVAHHLGTFPELATLASLAEGRPDFQLLRYPSVIACRVRIGGDVVLARDGGELALEDEKADLVMVNLEGIPSEPRIGPRTRFDFRFPAERIDWLVRNGIDGVSLANNHAGDAGWEALGPGIASLREAGLGVFGAGSSLEGALAPWIRSTGGREFAFFGVSCVSSLQAGGGRAGVLSLPENASRLERAIKDQKEAKRTVIVLAHWGREHTEEISEDQRKWAHWLVAVGADVVAGSGPHVRQPLDFIRGRPIAFSLGNAVPARLEGRGNGSWLEVCFDANGSVVRCRLE